jgi:hypothetical protein
MNYYSNLDICPRRISVLIDVGSHAMGYKDYSSNPDICPRRMTILDHFPQGECLSTSSLSFLDHFLHGECLSINILTIHLDGNHLQH